MRSAAAVYVAAAAVSALQAALPGGPVFAFEPAIVAAVLVPVILLVGPRVPRWTLAALGPIGAALVAVAVANAEGVSDAAILYCWPVLWIAYFYGVRETAVVVVAIAVAHGTALLSMTAGEGNIDRWLDVVISVTLIAGTVRVLAARNQRLVAKLRAEARVDPLTGLLNRRGLAERLEAELARGRRDGTELAVVSIDIDHFKTVNDSYGHDTGDCVLGWVADRIARQTRASDLTARMGGDEFFVVLPATDAAAARDFADRLRVSVAAGSRRLPEGLTVSISAGVASAPATEDAEALLTLADRALYTAKAQGRNVVALEDALDLSQRN